MSDKISTEPYKGVRDFYPEDMRILNHFFTTSKKVLASYGYEEYTASPLESAELYEAKAGENEEIVREQTYTFVDRGDRRVTLRPEMTPTVARMVAARRRELAFPLRWFSLPNVFRYERPQRGRLREHYQLNVDMFGVDTIEADIEIIAVAHDLMRAFGARPKDFSIKINNRALLFAALDHSGLSEEHRRAYVALLDKSAKISPEEFEQAKKEILGSCEDPARIISEERSVNVLDPKKNIEYVLEALRDHGITNAQYDPAITRGFNYYTGMVFEVFDTDPKNSRALFGGGRYDDLVTLFSDEKVSGAGFGMGDVTLRDFLETHDLIPGTKSDTHLYIGVLGETYIPHARRLQKILQQHGINVAIELRDKKVGDQIKVADKKGIPFFLALGENEEKESRYTLKNLSTGDDIILTDSEIPGYIKDTLRVSF